MLAPFLLKHGSLQKVPNLLRNELLTDYIHYATLKLSWKLERYYELGSVE